MLKRGAKDKKKKKKPIKPTATYSVSIGF